MSPALQVNVPSKHLGVVVFLRRVLAARATCNLCKVCEDKRPDLTHASPLLLGQNIPIARAWMNGDRETQTAGSTNRTACGNSLHGSRQHLREDINMCKVDRCCSTRCTQVGGGRKQRSLIHLWENMWMRRRIRLVAHLSRTKMHLRSRPLWLLEHPRTGRDPPPPPSSQTTSP